MKLQKRENIKLQNSILSALIVCCLATATMGQNQVRLQWGLENIKYFHEVNDVGMNQWARKYLPKRIRFFKENIPTRTLFECFQRHHELWDKYSQQSKAASKDPDRKEFEVLKRTEDKFCDGYFKEIAPTLYFDFTSGNSDEYVLDSIEVKTLGFGEYQGGGFVKDEAWYDIVLSHVPGTKPYAVERKLVFTGHGRIQLRFWSDNYYPNNGWIAPMGAYAIDIAFKFKVKNRLVVVKTGPFLIDV